MQPPADTIFALSSGSGRAAIAVIRVSGPNAHAALARMVQRVPAAREAALRRLRHPSTGDVIDDALVICFDRPASETGEDLVEFQVHGGRAVIQSMLAALSGIDGLRPAEPGEFVRRAFANGKLDLTAAEGLADLIDAETDAQRRRAIHQAGGVLARLYDRWRLRLIEAQALVEAAIDFADEGDVGLAVFAQGRIAAIALAGEIDAHLASPVRGEILRDGFQVVIAGPPNAGKSSLLNALARRDVAIVSAEAGTTRDVIEVRLDLDGLPVVVADTAGLRGDIVGAVEAEGIRRTRERARAADLVVWLIDAAVPAPAMPDGLAEAGTPVLAVLNKVDLLADRARLPVQADVAISARDGRGLPALLARIAAAARDATGDVDAVVPTSARHRHHLEQARTALSRAIEGPATEPELRAEDLRIAAAELGRITGRINPEDVLDRIFARFCIGK